MRRRYSWDESQGDLFGALAPKPAATKRLAPTESEVPKESALNNAEAQG